MSHYNWGHDVVRHTIELVREVSPGFELPADFFQGDPYLPDLPAAVPEQDLSGGSKS